MTPWNSNQPPFISGPYSDSPTQDISPYIQNLIKEDLKIFHQLELKSNSKNNINWEEKLSLRKLANNPNIIIKRANKGGQIVILDTNNYLQEAYGQ